MQPPHFSRLGNKKYWFSGGNSGCCSSFLRGGVLNGGDVLAVFSAICFLVLGERGA